ncbi:hypothetical protein HY415_01040, partial [Candidatus Kaiserbacteria bacterium]|nr:hypothetical protein [Candidatus Kaiserbacteria bacterium]
MYQSILVRSGRSALASFSAIAAVALLGSSLVTPSMALAAHTATVTVSPTLVKGGSSGTYSFNVANDSGSANFIDYVEITAPSGFSITGSVSCPATWGTVTTGMPSSIECVGSANPAQNKRILAGASATISFAATAPSVDSTNPWDVYTEDNNFDPQTNNPVTTVDATAPTISSITTKDTDSDGRVDTATIVFSEAVDDSTFAPNDFSVGGSTGTSISTGTADDNTFDVVVAGGVTGTEAKDVTYTKSAGAGADMVGNLLVDVNTAAFNEIDGAAPKLMAAQTVSVTSIIAAFSEDLNGATVNSSGSEFTLSAGTVTAASETSSGVVTLTVSPAFSTGATPDVTFTNSGTFTDLNGNEAVTPTTVTAADGIAPTFTAARTGLNTIVLTFSENVDVITTDGSGYTLSAGTVTANTDPAGTSGTITLTTSGLTGTSETPTVTYGATAGTTVDAATNEVTDGASVVASDEVAPTVVLASLTANPTNGLIAVTAEFSEDVTGFDATDITVGNGAVENFVATDGNSYT